jgi:quinol monooxygenase YgiN/predicted ester cyclase
MNNIEKNKQSIREFTRIFKNGHDVNGIDHLFAPDFQHNFKVAVSPGLKGLKEIGTIMNTAFPDVVVKEDDMIADETKVVERSNAVATNAGPYMNYPPTGRPIKWTEIHIYRFNQDGKIVEHWAEISSLELMLQIEAAEMKKIPSSTQKVVLATAKANAGREKDLENALPEVAAPTRAQQGCLQFEVFRSATDPSAIIGFEHWASEEDHARHLQGDHVKTLLARFDGVLSGPPEFVFMKPL